MAVIVSGTESAFTNDLWSNGANQIAVMENQLAR